MTSRQTLPFSVTFGDWSGDGHGISKVQNIEIHYSGPGELTETMILENYQANVAKLGFGLHDLWEEYEQYFPNDDQIEKLQDVLSIGVHVDSDIYSYSGPERDDSKLKLTIDTDDSNWYLKLAMAIVLSGLQNVDWVEIPRDRSLFGGSSSLLTGNEFVGYGLMDN